MDTQPPLFVTVIRALGVTRSARLCSVTRQAVMRWMDLGTLPRTEWTGETRYAETLADAMNARFEELGVEDRFHWQHVRGEFHPGDVQAV